MLHLQAGLNEECVFTLNEKITLEDPFLVIFFLHLDTREKQACLLGDERSIYTDRYNKFSITVKEDPDNETAEVDLKYGDHYFFIYERSSEFDFDNTQDFDLTSTTGLIESGIAKYSETLAPPRVYTNQSSSIKQYA